MRIQEYFGIFAVLRWNDMEFETVRMIKKHDD